VAKKQDPIWVRRELVPVIIHLHGRWDQKYAPVINFVNSRTLLKIRLHHSRVYQTKEPIRKILREQIELEWTLDSVGWLVDYVVPQNNRYLTDIGETFPIDLSSKTIIIPGTGNDLFDVTAARDLAKALVLLVKAPSWEQYTYISGEQTCFNDLARLVQQRCLGMSDIQHTGLGQTLETIQSSTDEEVVLLAHYKIVAPLGGGSFDPSKSKLSIGNTFLE